MNDLHPESPSLSPTPLAERLAAELGRDLPDLTNPLRLLAASLSEAVHGYVGLQLKIVQAGQPVVLTSLVPRQTGPAALTSLRLLLTGSERPLISGTLVVWSTVPGSLVDLAADLGQALPGVTTTAKTSPTHPWSLREEPARSPRRVVQLDVDLPLFSSARSGMSGVEELAAIYRATGVLIAQGHQPVAALNVLRGDAVAAGISNHAWAVRLLETPIN